MASVGLAGRTSAVQVSVLTNYTLDDIGNGVPWREQRVLNCATVIRGFFFMALSPITNLLSSIFPLTSSTERIASRGEWSL
jgi:hypothetical protein